MIKKNQNNISKENEISGNDLNLHFSEICKLIRNAKERAYHAVNFELIDLYWQVGE